MSAGDSVSTLQRRVLDNKVNLPSYSRVDAPAAAGRRARVSLQMTHLK